MRANATVLDALRRAAALQKPHAIAASAISMLDAERARLAVALDGSNALGTECDVPLGDGRALRIEHATLVRAALDVIGDDDDDRSLAALVVDAILDVRSLDVFTLCLFYVFV